MKYLILFIAGVAAIKFDYKDGQLWEIAMPKENGSQEYQNTLKFVSDIQEEFPELLFWTGTHPQDTNSPIFSCPAYLEPKILRKFKGISIEKYMEPFNYLKNFNTTLISGRLFQQHTNNIKSKRSSSLLSSLNDVTATNFVVHTGLLYISYEISTFKYDLPVQQAMNDLKKPIDIISTITIPNKSSATVSITLSEARTLIQRISISFTETLGIGGSASISLNIPDIGLGGSLEINLCLELPSTQSIEHEEDITFAISKTITILPYSTIKAYGYVNWIDGLIVPFDASAKIIPSLTNSVGGNSTNSNDGSSKPIAPAPAPTPTPTAQPPKLYYCPIETTSTWSQCFYSCGSNRCNPDCININNCTCCFYEINEKNMKNPFVLRDYLIAEGETNFEIIDEGNDGKPPDGLYIKFKGNLTANFGMDVVYVVEDA